MTSGTLHTTWLSLIDRSGPFLSVQVLESALPQGLEAVQTKFKQKLRLAYEEWRDAADNQDPLLAELHKEWIKLVLGEILEYDNSSLISNSSDGIKYTNEELAIKYMPSLAVKSSVSNKIRFFIDVLPPDTDFEKPIEGDKWPASFVEKMTLLCRSQKVRYGLLTNGEKWTIVSAPIGATSGTATWYSRLWRYEPVTLKAFQTLLGVRRCFGPEQETLDTLLDSSLNSYEEVTNTLGEQVRRAVEVLIQSLDSADQDRNRELLDGILPSELYDASVTVMMRLVFLLCAEERELLLLGEPIYDQFYAVTTLRAQLAEDAGKLGPEVLERRHDAWSRLLATFRAIYAGIEHETLRLPPLGGSLFDPDKYPFLEGRKSGSSWKNTNAKPLPIDNRTVLLLLTALQVLEQKGGALHLSYRALDVEQIGHVYEGLLDSTVSRVPEVTLALIGSKQTKSNLLKLSELETEVNKGHEALSAHLEEKIQRKSGTVLKAINTIVSDTEYGTLILACGGDEDLATKIKPFFHLLQMDIWGHPLVYKAGSYAVTKGLDRKETGTHYTPKSLTEHIVSLTLEPLVFNGASEGLPRGQWTLKASKDILKIKVCDPAMGSAAFLVQACRFLSEHLVLAWSNEAIIAPDSSLHDNLLNARRLVAEKCLYGVDKNPLAVELSKLSIWLVTLSKGKPFEFLDNNLKSGDSILGIHSLNQLTEFGELTRDSQMDFFDSFVNEKISNSIRSRQEIRAIHIKDVSDIKKASDIFKAAELEIQNLKLIADVISTAYLENTSLTRKPNEAVLKSNIYEYLKGSTEAELYLKDIFRLASRVESDNRIINLAPFHWLIEFPEVFAEGGFSAFIGNPPFLGNKYWKSMLGGHVQSLAKAILEKTPGKIDICLVFHRKICQLLQENGTYGLLATNNIAEGSAVNIGLQKISESGSFYWAKKAFPWPGSASVSVAIVCFFKGNYSGVKICNDEVCEHISPKLEKTDSTKQREIYKIKNSIFCFAGIDNSKGLAFLVSENDQWLNDLTSEENHLVRPYFSGEDITYTALAIKKRYTLDIGDRSLEEIKRNWPKAFEFLNEKVLPTRTTEALKSYKGLIDRWWQFWNNRSGLYSRLRKNDLCIVYPKAPKYPMCMLAPSNWIYTNKVLLMGIERNDQLAVCLSSFFYFWLEEQSGGKLGKVGSLTLSIDQAIDTFPQPRRSVSETGISSALQFNEIMTQWCHKNQVGLTAFMDKYHSLESIDESILRAREFRQIIDQEVSNSYDLNLDVIHDHRKYHGHLPIGLDRYGVSEEIRTQILSFLITENNKQHSENRDKASTMREKK